jgi:hypothetical protein
MAIRKTHRTRKSTTRAVRAPKMSARRSASRSSRREPWEERALPASPVAKARRPQHPEVGGMTVREAGRKGGLIGGRKGGLAVKSSRGREFYQEIGRKGGQRVRDLIAAGRRTEEGRAPARRRHTS